MNHGIAIVGGNGSGKTTLGKYLAELLGYKHMDVEDYYFHNSTIPYTKPRTKEEVQNLILADIETHHRFIVSSVNADMGCTINAFYECIVYIDVPLDIRLERIKARAFDKFGDRVLEGGDMYEQEQHFFCFVANRTMEKTDAWIQSMTCPVIHIDGRESVEKNAQLIKEKMYK